MRDRITEFAGPHRWLSNFVPALVWYDGLHYPTVEHAYQASKTEDGDERVRVRACPTPGQAKRVGRHVTLRADFEQGKKEIMLDLLRQKFRLYPYRKQLLGSGDREIIEGNSWGDTYWGVCRGQGQNVLGQLIMQVRGELRVESRFVNT